MTISSYVYNVNPYTWKDGLYINSLSPSDAIWWQWSWTTLAQVMACCLMAPSHYLNQCWRIISEVYWHSGNQLMTISQEMPQPSITKISLKNTYQKFHSNLPGGTELTCPWMHSLMCLVVFALRGELPLPVQHIEAETRWLPFSRWHFQMPFLEWKCINFDWDFTVVRSQWSNSQYSTIGSDNGLLPARHFTGYITVAYMHHSASVS